MKDCVEEKPDPVPDAVRSARHGSLKKKYGMSNLPISKLNFFSCFQGKERPNLYKKTIDWLALYSSM